MSDMFGPADETVTVALCEILMVSFTLLSGHGFI